MMIDTNLLPAYGATYRKVAANETIFAESALLMVVQLASHPLLTPYCK